MATARSAKVDEELPERQPQIKLSKPPQARPARRLILAASVLLLIALYFAPWIVSQSGLRNSALAVALQVDGSVSAGSASFGWFSPVLFSDVEISDADGQPVIVIDAIEGDKSLLSLLLNRRDAGGYRLVHPRVHLIVDEKGSNLEDLFRPMLKSSSGAAVRVEIVDGLAKIVDVASRREHELQDVQAVVACPGDPTSPLTIQASGKLPTDAKAASFQIDLNARHREGTPGVALNTGSLNCLVDAMPLSLAEPFARRALPGARLAGRLGCNLQGVWGDDQQQTVMQGKAVVRGFELAANALGRDRLAFDSIEIPCNISQRGEEIQIKELSIECDLGKATLHGAAAASVLEAVNPLQAALREAFTVEASFDLAALARMLPDALRVREGVQIASGQLTCKLISADQRDAHSWTGDVSARDLTAAANGKKIAWNDALQANFVIDENASGLTLRSGKCRSSFLQVDAAGTPQNLKLSASYDLARLYAELHQFLDLSNMQLAGQGSADLQLRTAERGAFTATGALATRNLQCALPGWKPLMEPSLTAQLDLEGQAADGRLQRVDSAIVQFVAGRDKLHVELTKPLADLSEPWPLSLDWQGDLAVWLPRLQAIMDVRGWEAAGAARLTAQALVGKDAVSVDSGKLAVARLHLHGPGLYIDENQAELQVAGTMDLKGVSGKIRSGKFLSTSLDASLADVAWTMNSDRRSLSGGCQFDGDLNRLSNWINDPRKPKSVNVSGRAAGKATIKAEGGLTQASLVGDVDQLRIDELGVNGGAAASWQEPRLSVAFKAGYRTSDDAAELTQLSISSNALACDVAGQIQRVSTTADAVLAGAVRFDWQKLAPLWRPLAGQSVNLVGAETREFRVKGPLRGPNSDGHIALRSLSGQGGIGWSQADIYGLSIGQGELKLELNDGLLQVQPAEFDVSEGRVTIAPWLRLEPQPMELRLAKGPLASNVRVTPELCARGLKFVAPILAEATEADGRFSIDLEGGRIPLADLSKGDVAGRLTVHKMEVRPGPVAQQILFLGRQIESLLRGAAPPLEGASTADALVTIEEQNVDFRMMEGRVYHKGIQIMAGKTPIRTRGSVGLDDTIDLIAEIDVQDSWVGRSGPFAAMKGQTLQVPLTGTLQRPKLDGGALKKLGGQVIENTAKGLLLDGLNRGLDKLLPGQ